MVPFTTIVRRRLKMSRLTSHSSAARDLETGGHAARIVRISPVTG